MKKSSIISFFFKLLSICVFCFGICISSLYAQTNIEIGQVYNFTQEPSSTENYSFTTESPGQFTIHTNFWLSTYDWSLDYDRVYVYNSEGVAVDRNLFSTDEDPFLFHMIQGNSGLIFNLGKAGTYTISVHSGQRTQIDWGDATMQSYELSVTSVFCMDAYEQNDNISTASPIGLGSTINAYQWMEHNTSEVWGDEDWYELAVPSSGILKIELVDWVGIYNWSADYDRLYVFNDAGESIGNTDGEDYYKWMMGGGTEEEPYIIEMNLTAAGNYYLGFHAGAGVSTTPYSFTTSFIGTEDPNEPNDDFVSATLIPSSDVWYPAYEWRTLDNTMNIYGDEDYYYFFAAAAGDYSLSLEGWIPIFNWGADYDRLYVFDADENPVGDSPYAWMMGTAPIVISVPAQGKYYLQLHCGGTYSMDGYQYKLSGLVDNVTAPEEEHLVFQLQPNPASNKVIINMDKSNNENITVAVYDLTGKLVLSNVINQYRDYINVTDFVNGIYLVEIKSKDRVGNQKMIIQK